MAGIDNEYAVIDSRDVEKEIRRLEKRIKILKGLGNAYPKESVNWLEGVTLIRDSFFVQYAKATAADASDMNVWPLQHINWVNAVEAFKAKHVPIDFEGVTYWVKKPI